MTLIKVLIFNISLIDIFILLNNIFPVAFITDDCSTKYSINLILIKFNISPLLFLTLSLALRLY